MNVLGALAMSALWFVICFVVSTVVAVHNLLVHLFAAVGIFVATLALAAWRTRNANLNDNAEEVVARRLTEIDDMDPAKRMNPLRDRDREIQSTQLFLVILTTIPAIAVGMLTKAFASDDE